MFLRNEKKEKETSWDSGDWWELKAAEMCTDSGVQLSCLMSISG